MTAPNGPEQRQVADYVAFDALPLEVRNALLCPVYDHLTEEEALDGVADVIVGHQLAGLRRWGWAVTRIAERTDG